MKENAEKEITGVIRCSSFESRHDPSAQERVRHESTPEESLDRITGARPGEEYFKWERRNARNEISGVAFRVLKAQLVVPGTLSSRPAALVTTRNELPAEGLRSKMDFIESIMNVCIHG